MNLFRKDVIHFIYRFQPIQFFRFLPLNLCYVTSDLFSLRSPVLFFWGQSSSDFLSCSSKNSQVPVQVSPREISLQLISFLIPLYLYNLTSEIWLTFDLPWSYYNKNPAPISFSVFLIRFNFLLQVSPKIASIQLNSFMIPTRAEQNLTLQGRGEEGRTAKSITHKKERD